MTDLLPGAHAHFLGVRFDNVSLQSALDTIARLSKDNKFEYVVTPNVDHLVRLHSDEVNPLLKHAYAQATLCLCDSRILQLMSRLSPTPLGVLPGSDLTARLLELDLGRHPRIAVIGGDATLLFSLQHKYPASRWEQHVPPMGLMTNQFAQEQVVQYVENSRASLYLFAIGSPQSELLCFQIKSRGKAAGVGLCIGASLEFLTGAKSRAPLWMQRCSLEWLYRLLSEPRRLSRRYLLDGPRIISIWWRHR